MGLSIDLHTTNIKSHFTQSIERSYTESESALKDFEQRFAKTWVIRIY